MGGKGKWIVGCADGENGGIMAVEKSAGLGDETGDVGWGSIRRERVTIMCLSGVEAEIVCTGGCQGVLGGFHLWAVGSCRRGRRLPVGLQWESATSALWAPSTAVVERRANSSGLHRQYNTLAII